jgi:hypothetical protein
MIAFSALIIAVRNLNSVKRAQCVQSHMNLISLENELRKNQIAFKSIMEKYTKACSPETFSEKEIVSLSKEKDVAFELYVSYSDKLASIINTDYLQKQFKDTRDWKDEYYDIFKEAKMTYDDYPKITITGRESMIRNLDKILRNWNKKASSQQQA